MKKFIKSMIILLLFIIISTLFVEVKATDNEKLTRQEILNLLENETSIDTQNLDVEQIVEEYNKLSTKYSNEEIATVIQENKTEIEKQVGISENTIDKGAQFLRDSSEEDIRDIVNNDLDIHEIQEKLNQGQSLNSVIEETLTPQKTITIGAKLVLANKYVKIAMRILLIEFLIITIARWIIYKKAGKHGWAVLIPIYRDITYYQVCNMSPWWLLLILIPIVGWITLIIVYIVSRFKLAKSFEKGILFGFGLLILRPVFELILAIFAKTYIKEDE